MKCPKCGSENTQFCTSTSGRGFSTGKACCGTILLGPLGLLCGGIGSGVSTEEFWMCHNCGHRFSTGAGQNHLEQEMENKRKKEALLRKYDAYKLELSQLSDIEGDYEEISAHYFEAIQKNKDAVDKCISIRKSKIESENFRERAIAKQLNSSETYLKIELVLIVIGILMLAVDLTIACLVLVTAGICLWRTFKSSDKKEEELAALDLEYKTACEERTKAEEEEKRLKNLYDKVAFIEEFEKNNGAP